jgi:hypothetical protein
VIHYDNKSRGFTSVSIIKKKLTDSIYISAEYAIIRVTNDNRRSERIKSEIVTLVLFPVQENNHVNSI